MNPEHPFPTDDAIERGLARRAPHGADLDLRDALMAEVRSTRQAPHWWPPTELITPRSRRRVIWVAVAAALGIVIAATVLGGGAARPPLSLIVPQVSVSPAASPSADPSAASPEPTACASDAIEATTVPFGTRVASDLAFPGLGAGRIAFLTYADSATQPAIELWVASGDPAIATLIAQFRGLKMSGSGLAAWPGQGSNLLVTISHNSTEVRFSPQCTNVYVVASDGSQIRRVNRPPQAGVSVTGASLSPDGSIAAFLDASDAGTTFQVERSSGIGNSPACSDTYLLGTPVWSPDGSRVAVACASRVLILDLASDVFTPFDLQDRQPVALSWTEDGNHLLAATFYQALGSGSPAVGHRSIAVDSLDTTTGSWTAVARPVDPSIDWTTVGDTDRGQGFAPDGRHLLMGTFVVDLATSAVQTVVPNQALGWTLDGSAITSVVESESPSVNLRVQRQSLSGQAPSGVGILPYSAGQLLHSGSDLMSIAVELP